MMPTDPLGGMAVAAGRGSNHGGGSASGAHDGSGEAIPLSPADTMDPGRGIASPFDSSRVLEREINSDKLSNND
jgi:hypothetical protein